jgi:amino acid adenylation domain-containing protein
VLFELQLLIDLMDNLSTRIANLSPAKRALLEKKLQQKAGSTSAKKSIIPRRQDASTAPLMLVQQRLWLLNQLDPTSPFYNMKLGLKLHGELNVEALRKALIALVARHEPLRTTFVLKDGSPIQQIAQEWSFDVPLIDLTEHVIEQDTVLNNIFEEANRPFDLASDLMIRAELVRLSAQEHILLITLHHIIADGWSVEVLAHDLSMLYEAFSKAEPFPLSDLTVSYGDVAAWQQARLTGEVLEQQLAYWRKQLAAPPVLELPTDYPRSPVQTFNGDSHYFRLDVASTQQLKQLSQEHGTTLFVTLLTAYAVLLSRYSRQDDIIIGSPFASRNYRELEPLIGLFLKTLPLRINLSGVSTFRELLQHTKQVALDAYTYQDVPFEQLVEELHPERDPSQSPWFQVMFAFQNYPKHNFNLTGIQVEQLPIESRTAKFDLALTIVEEDGSLQVGLSYNTDLFADETIQRMVGHLQTLLKSIAANSDQPLFTLPMLPLREQQQLLEWAGQHDSYPSDRCIHQLVEEQAAHIPDAIAIVGSQHQLTYRELNQRANQLARHLQGLGIKADSLVGLCMERSPDMLVGMLGILKAGGAYVPIDPAYPVERQAFLLSDAQPAVLVTQQQFKSKWADAGVPLLCLDTDWPDIAQYDTSNLEPISGPTNLAYVIYTSGSTGQPKGVLIPHQALVNFTLGAIAQYGIAANDRVLQFASISFDAAAEEVYPCLCSGGTLVLRSDAALGSAATLLRYCQEQAITVLDLPTAYWHQIAAEVANSHPPLPPALRLVLIGGEQANFNRLCQWQSWAESQAQQANRQPPQVVNTYGPTETTVVATYYPVPNDESVKADGGVPIGRSLPNVLTYVLDRHLQLVPPGIPGELYIGGAGLARGYLNRPDLTKQSFVPNPFSPNASDRLYKTGDLVKYRPDGQLEFLGRVDDQVKIRGFRIELGEVETALTRYPYIQNAVASVQDDQGEKQLVAYVVPSEQITLTLADLRRHLRTTLPDYMIPSTFVVLDTIPLTPTGKVDRRLLPTLAGSRLTLAGEFVAPRTPTEVTLVGFWRDLLKVEQVSIHGHFFELGGHSLAAARLAARIAQAFSIDLSLRSIFQFPTIAELAEHIDTILWTRQVPAEPSSDTEFEEGEL